jgi:GNAT superfamily N-acetyltransferase
MPTPADHVLRPLTPDDVEASLALGVEAFGTPPAGTPAPPPPTQPRPGRHSWGTFDADGRLVARVVAREFGSWFGGVEVPTCGVAGVTVVAERRGDGLLEDLVRALLDEALARGEVISTLYPTAPGIYRRFGYELVGSLDEVELPTSELLGVRAPVGVTTRRATVEDVPAVHRVYDRWAAAQNGPLTRRGASFPAAAGEYLADVTGVTLALDAAGEVVGFAAWRRGEGYEPSTAVLEVEDLIALSGEAHRALWRVLGTFSAVAGRVRLTTSGDDPARLVLPGGTWRVVGTHPYALRLLDVERAFALRPLGRALAPAMGHAPEPAPAGPADVAFTVTGDAVGRTDGGYRLRVSADATTCERTGADDGPTFTPQGIALAWAGVQSCANLRMTGHLSGPTTYDATLDALLGAGRLHVRDYF